MTIPSAELQSMKIHVRIDVSPSAPFDKLAQEQSFENLLAAGHITFEEYVALLSDSSAMPKQKLVDLLKERERKLEEQAQAQTAPGSARVCCRDRMRQPCRIWRVCRRRCPHRACRQGRPCQQDRYQQMVFPRWVKS